MNTGGIHILGGLLSFGAVFVVLSLYLLSFLILLAALFWLFNLFKVRSNFEAWKITKRIFVTKPIAFIFIIFLLLNCSVYLKQRAEWMGNDNGNFEAKEYYVSGQVLYLYRSGLTRLLHPDNVLLNPLEILQKIIFNIGKGYLPGNDGEIGIWTDLWFVYPYSRNNLKPKGYVKYVNNGELAPMLKDILDKSWFCIQAVATSTFADQQMYKQHYLRNFPGMVYYYSLNEGYYAGNKSGSSFRLSTDQKIVSRREKTVEWLKKIDDEWRQYPDINRFVNFQSQVRAYWYVGISMTIGELLTSRIDMDSFDCNDPLWAYYQEIRDEYAVDRGEGTVFDWIHDKRVAMTFRNISIDGYIAKFHWWVFKQYCDFELAGDIDWSEDERLVQSRGTTFEKYMANKYDSNYRLQINKLEGKHGNK
jgi:hypothetical protein